MSSPTLSILSVDSYGLEEKTSYFLTRSVFKANKRKMCILVGREELALGVSSGNGVLGWMQQVKFFSCLFVFLIHTFIKIYTNSLVLKCRCGCVLASTNHN